MEDIWITSTSQIAGASAQSLFRAILTCDGSGAVVKQAVLRELLYRDKLASVPNDEGNTLMPFIGHPYTCGNADCRAATNGAPLRATPTGLICDRCGYTQKF